MQNQYKIYLQDILYSVSYEVLEICISYVDHISICSCHILSALFKLHVWLAATILDSTK